MMREYGERIKFIKANSSYLMILESEGKVKRFECATCGNEVYADVKHGIIAIVQCDDCSPKEPAFIAKTSSIAQLMRNQKSVK